MTVQRLALSIATAPTLQVLDSAWADVGAPTYAGYGTCLEWSPDGSLVAIGYNDADSDPYLKIVRASDWTAVSGTPALPSQANDVAWSPDGSLLAVALSASPYLRIYNTATWSQVSSTPTLPRASRTLAFAPDGSRLYCAPGNNSAILGYAVGTWSAVSGLPTPGAICYDMRFSPSGDRLALATASAAGGLVVYNTGTWTKITVPAVGQNGTGCAWSPDGGYLALTYDFDPYLRVIRATDWTTVTGPAALPNVGTGVSFSADGSKLAVGIYVSPYLRVLNVSDWSIVSGTPTPAQRPNALAFTQPDGAPSLTKVSQRHQAVWGGEQNAVARSVAPWAARSSVSARHVGASGAMPGVGQRLLASWGAMPAVSARHSAPAAAMSALAARVSTGWAVCVAVSARHAALAAVQSAHQVADRLEARWSAPDTRPEVIVSASPEAPSQIPPGAIDATPVLTHGGRQMALCAPLDLSCDEGSSVWSATLNLTEVEDYARVAPGDKLSLSLGATTWKLVCDSKQFSRGDPPTYQIKAMSPAAKLGSPWSLSVRLGDVGMAHATVERILGKTVSWEIPDWRLPDSAAELEADPLTLAQQIIAAAGGVLESLPDGSLRARLADPVSIPDYPQAESTHLTDRDLDAHSTSVGAPEIANRYVITSGELGSNGDQIQVEAVQDEDDPHAYTIRAFPMPWREVELVHTGDAATHIGTRRQTDVETEELVEIVSGSASLRYPLASLVSASYQYADLGEWTQPDQKKIQTAIGGYSLLAIKYKARAWEWRATNARTETIQFLTVE